MNLDAYPTSTGMSEDELLLWLTSSNHETAPSPQTDIATITGLPSWLMPEVVKVPQTPAPVKEFPIRQLNTDWRRQWDLASDESQIETETTTRDLLSRGLHVMTDERRILLFALIGMKPEGIDGAEIIKKYSELLYPDGMETGVTASSLCPSYQIEPWLVENGLAEIVDRSRMRIREFALTDDGNRLLPFAGHLLDWATHYGNVGILLGHPKDSFVIGKENGSTCARMNLSLIEYMLDSPKDLFRFNDLMSVEGSSTEPSRKWIERMSKGRWIVRIPASYQPESNYPKFVPIGKIEVSDKKPKSVREALLQYVLEYQSANPGPMTLHGMIYHGKYRALSRKAGSPQAFAGQVFQEYERLYSEGLLDELTSSTIRVSIFAPNPAKETALRRLISIVRGAEIASEEYETLGIQKLFHILKDPNMLKRLTERASVKPK
jgi:hypothetical protein